MLVHVTVKNTFVELEPVADVSHRRSTSVGCVRDVHIDLRCSHTRRDYCSTQAPPPPEPVDQTPWVSSPPSLSPGLSLASRHESGIGNMFFPAPHQLDESLVSTWSHHGAQAQTTSRDPQALSGTPNLPFVAKVLREELSAPSLAFLDSADTEQPLSVPTTKKTALTTPPYAQSVPLEEELEKQTLNIVNDPTVPVTKQHLEPSLVHRAAGNDIAAAPTSLCSFMRLVSPAQGQSDDAHDAGPFQQLLPCAASSPGLWPPADHCTTGLATAGENVTQKVMHSSSVSNTRRHARRAAAKKCLTCVGPAKQVLSPRRMCCFYLRIRHATFDLVPMIIGRGGCNTRNIADQTGAKIRVRGKGSGHLEAATRREAPTPLMLVVATEADNSDGFFKAIELSVQLLRRVESRYVEHCKRTGSSLINPAFTIGPLCDESWWEMLSAVNETLPPRHTDMVKETSEA
mmetsp:Transcript_46660/g.107822  ORF Transcript_46660/g.107822 Transcript_46660/m.107822 type:complete len:458 (+) Transcript_46660:49-1422(+)